MTFYITAQCASDTYHLAIRADTAQQAIALLNIFGKGFTCGSVGIPLIELESISKKKSRGIEYLELN